MRIATTTGSLLFRIAVLSMLWGIARPTASAQVLIDPASRWNCMFCVMNLCWTDIYWFEGDTLINDIPYTQLYKGSPYNDLTDYAGAMREGADSTILFVPAFWNEEMLIYDFGLQIGEVFAGWTNEGCYYESVVMEVDTILLDDGVPRRRLHFDGMITEQWTTGIGSNHGLLGPGYGNWMCSPIDAGGTLLCWYHEESLQYQDAWYPCEYNTLDVMELSEDAGLHIWPVPSNGTFQVSLPMTLRSGGQLQMLDASGRAIYSEQITSATQEVHVTSIGSGSYLVRYTSPDGTLHQQRVVVTK